MHKRTNKVHVLDGFELGAEFQKHICIQHN